MTLTEKLDAINKTYRNALNAIHMEIKNRIYYCDINTETSVFMRNIDTQMMLNDKREMIYKWHSEAVKKAYEQTRG